MNDALRAVRTRLTRAGGDHVTVVAITKGFGAEAIRAVADAGCDDIGESYAQEVVAKLSELGDRPGLRVHFVGQLQTNKVRALASLVDCWDSLDRVPLLDEVARRAPAAEVLLQVNTTGEQSKAGVAPGELGSLLRHANGRGLRVGGLMTVGPTEGGSEAARPSFRLLRRLVDEHGLKECSMGMSNDLEVAVEEGSTQVRIGTAIFGPRPRRGRRVG